MADNEQTNAMAGALPKEFIDKVNEFNLAVAETMQKLLGESPANNELKAMQFVMMSLVARLEALDPDTDGKSLAQAMYFSFQQACADPQIVAARERARKLIQAAKPRIILPK